MKKSPTVTVNKPVHDMKSALHGEGSFQRTGTLPPKVLCPAGSKKVLNSQGSSIILTDGEKPSARELTRLKATLLQES